MSPSRSAQAVLVVILAMLCALTSAPAHASTWYVTPSGNDGSDCQTASTPCLTINRAIVKAADGDTVLVSEGTYTATAGGEVVLLNKSLTLSGGWDVDFAAQGATSIIDGWGVWPGITVSANAAVTVVRFTIQHGHKYGYGGGLSNTGTLTLKDCFVTDNGADYGGGIYNSGVLTLEDCIVTGNGAAYGGGIHNSGALTLGDCFVTDNAGIQGAGIYNSGALTLEDCAVTKNRADRRGGGIYSNSGTLTVNRTAIDANTTGEVNSPGFDLGGGGIESYGTVVLNDSTVKGNVVGVSSPGGQGGGILAGGPTVLNRSTVSGNTLVSSSTYPLRGGCGIYAGSTLELNNSTVSGNGGGDCQGILAEYATVSLNNSTVARNQSRGLEYYLGSVSMQNTIIAGNGPSGDCLRRSLNGEVASGGYNLIGNGEGCSITAGPGDQIGDAAAPIDPLLLPLRDYGGPTATHALRKGSPALDAGNPAIPGSGGGACLATDQRGQPRPEGSACDIGTFEGYLPFVASIARAGPGRCGESSVDFTVTFTEAVTGVDSLPPFSDFVLTTTGAAGASITAVSGYGATYVVSVGTGVSDGTIRLDVVDDDTILGAVGNPLGGPETGNGDYTDGEVYTICFGSPTLYVATTGNDTSDCQSTATPCLTVNNALSKVFPGCVDTIRLARGTYTADSGSEVVLVDKSITLSGGWEEGFSTQDDTSVLDGGGARRGVTVSATAVATLERFTIRRGLSPEYTSGGGIYNAGTLTLEDCVITENSSQSGGGIYSRGTLTLEDSIISNNVANDGGGIYSYGMLMVNRTTVSANVAGHEGYSGGGGGGGISSQGTFVLSDSTVSDNSLLGAFYGGGILTYGSFTMSNSTVSGNSCHFPCSGLYLRGGTATVNNSTITHNESFGLIIDFGQLSIQNSILAGNGADRDCLNRATVASNGHNIIGNGEGCSITAGPGDLIGTATAPIDPMLLPLRSNGGPTQTHALRSGSPALNAGNPAAPGGGDDACLATDQRGKARPQGSACDIGAFEGFVTSVASITRLDPSPTFAASVDFAVSFSDPVTGVDTAPPFSDFALTTTGVVGAVIDAVSGSGDTYTVSVLTGDRDGTIRLDVVDDDSIFNSDDTPMGGIGAGNGNFTDGEVYTIWGNPRVTSIVRADPNPTDAASVDFTVTFSEPVNGIDLIPSFSDFALTATGVTTGAISGVTGSGNTYTVTVSLDAHNGNGTIRLDVVDDDSILDAAGNPLGGEGAGNGDFTSGEPYTVIKIPLILSPSGRISTATPRYEWSRVPRATRYRYQLFKGSTLVYTKTVSWKACGNTTCSDKPGTRLRMIPYKWRMQALVDGKWRRYSAYNTFTVSPRAGYWWSNDYLDFTVQPDLASLSEFSLYVYVEGCGIYIITYPDLVPITDGRFAFKGSFYASGTFSTPFRVSGKVGLRMHYLSDCGYVSGGPFSWTGDWEAPALLDSAAADSDRVSVTPMRAHRAGPFRVDSVAP